MNMKKSILILLYVFDITYLGKDFGVVDFLRKKSNIVLETMFVIKQELPF